MGYTKDMGYESTSEIERELIDLYADVIEQIVIGEDTRLNHVIVIDHNYYFAHNSTLLTHQFFVGHDGLELALDGCVKVVEYPHLEYMVLDHKIDTSDCLQVVKHAAIHEAAHMIEQEFGGYTPSDHLEDYETILLDLLERYWSKIA